MAPPATIPITGDGACLRVAIPSHSADGEVVRELLTKQLVDNWKAFSIMYHDGKGGRATRPAQRQDKFQPWLGSLCKDRASRASCQALPSSHTGLGSLV